MESKKIAKQLVEFQKATFNNAFTALVMVQDQTEAMFKSMMSQVPGMPEEGKKWFRSGPMHTKRAVRHTRKRWTTGLKNSIHS
jgi:hypothetical protein